MASSRYSARTCVGRCIWTCTTDRSSCFWNFSWLTCPMAMCFTEDQDAVSHRERPGESKPVILNPRCLSELFGMHTHTRTHTHTHTTCVCRTGPQLSPVKSVSKRRTWTSVYLDILKAPQFDLSQSWESLAWTMPLSTGLGWMSDNNSSQQRWWEIFCKAGLWENFSSLFNRGMRMEWFPFAFSDLWILCCRDVMPGVIAAILWP